MKGIQLSTICAHNVTYKYDDGFIALDNINFSISSGEFICIVGHSGCGKSTLLRLISGLSLPTSGELTIDDRRVEGPGLDRAVVFQQYSLFPWMTARKNVEFGLEQAFPDLSQAERNARVDCMLEQVGMLAFAEMYPYQLSGGMKQRVAIARAFILDSDTLLLDEPFGALDQKRREQLQQMLLDLWQQGSVGENAKRKTVVFVTHDIDEALLLADRIFFMTPGRIAEIIEVDCNSKRDLDGIPRDIRCAEIKNQLLELFSLESNVVGDDDEL